MLRCTCVFTALERLYFGLEQGMLYNMDEAAHNVIFYMFSSSELGLNDTPNNTPNDTPNDTPHNARTIPKSVKVME